MKKYLSLIAGGAILASSVAIADTSTAINLNPDPYGTPWIANLPELTPTEQEYLNSLPEFKVNNDGVSAASAGNLPTSVDNSQNIHFRPIFTQKGGDCAHASSISYVFTYEMAAARNLDAGLPENQYPEHFTWNFQNDGKGNGTRTTTAWYIAEHIGVPNVTTYGGMTSPTPYINWINGYDKYYQAMQNRLDKNMQISTNTVEGIESLKQWLYDHGDGSSVGGLALFASFIGDEQDTILSNDSAHAGESIITSFGGYGHVMTIVGYDDDVMVDINGDGQYTNNIDINDDGEVNIKDWEIGAVKMANTYGTSWGNSGFMWIPYSVLSKTNQAYIMNVKETHTPDMTLKIKIQHESRKKLTISAGIATSVYAAIPEYQIDTGLATGGGDLPMLGDSNDPLEFGIDVTSLVEQVGGINNAKKLFLTIKESDNTDSSTGKVISVSAINYKSGGIEYRATENISIENNTTTIIPVLLQGEQCEEYTAANSEHEAAGRAYSETTIEGQTCWGTYCYGGTEVTRWYAIGSDDDLGTSGSTETTLNSQSEGIYDAGACPAEDVTAPELTLIGDNPLYIYQYNEVVDPGATAIDDIDGDISEYISVTGYVDTSVINESTLTYSISDAAGNTTKVERVVKVIEAPTCVDFTDTVANHETAGRAYSQTTIEGQTCWGTYCYGGTEVTNWYAVGSNEDLGQDNGVTITMIENPYGSGSYTTGKCPSINPPTIDSYEYNIDGNTLTITGTASDPDNDLRSIISFIYAALTCEGTENFVCTFPNLENGEYTIGLLATDEADNNSETIYFTVNIGTPSAPKIDSFKAERSQTTIIVNGQASDADGDLTTVQLHEDSIGTIDCTLELPDFYCRANNLVPGETYNFYLTAEDELGNVSAPSSNIEVIMPESNAPIIESYNYELVGKDLIVTGVSSDVDNDILSTVLYVTGGGITCNGLENWTCTIEDIQTGTHQFRLKTSDSYLNDSQFIDFEVVVEDQQSAPTIDSYEYSIEGNTLTVTGTASDVNGDLEAVIMVISAGPMTCEGTETFTCTITSISIGDNAISLYAADAAGNESEAIDFTVTYSGTAPTIDSYEYSTDGLTVTFTGTASDVDGDLDRIVMTLGILGGEICTGTETFTCTWTAETAGTYAIGLAAYDTNGLVDTIPQIEITVSEQGECITDTNYNHVAAGRAYQGGLSNLYAYAVGSDDDLGLYGSTYYSTTTSLEETSPGYWTKVTSCP